jgi:hypothetical protein
MPNISDNKKLFLLPKLKEILALSYRVDFCVGYFNLKGWNEIDNSIDYFSREDGNCAQLLVGMQPPT